MQYLRFVVGDTPYCIWDWDLREQNLSFLDSIDPDFFFHMAEVNVASLNEENENSRHAALALRLFYSHGLETLLSLLGAAVQAPECVVGWLSLYRERHLKMVIDSLFHHQPLLSRLSLDPPGWESLSNVVHRFIVLEDKEKESKIKQGFASFWKRLAANYSRKETHHEYNSIKHGLRARSGGYTLRMRREKELGVPDPDAPIRTVASSKYGSSYYEVLEIGLGKNHRGIRHHSTNWDPQTLVRSIEVVVFSLKNLIGFLRAVNGVDPRDIQFSWPKDLEVFNDALRGVPGRESFSTGPHIDRDSLTPFSKEEILRSYEVPEGPENERSD